MKKSDIQLANILTYSGTLPLVACSVLSLARITVLDSHLLASTYSAVIISFLCGIHWSTFLLLAEKCSVNLLLTSNIFALLAWTSLLFPYQEMTYLFQALCFICLLLIDLKLRNSDVLPEWFFHLRRNATGIVVSCLVALAVLS